MTHWLLDGDVGVEIVNFIDDYSRAVLASAALPVATAADVVRIFFDTAAMYGFLGLGALRQRRHLHVRLSGQPHRHGDRVGHPRDHLQTRQALSPPNTGKGGALPPHAEEVVGQRSRRHEPWPSSKPRSTASSTSTTRSDPTRRAGAHRCKRGEPSTRPPSKLTGSRCWPTPRSCRNRADSTGCFTLRYRSGFHHVSVGRVHKGKRVLILMADLDVRAIYDDGVLIRHLELDPSINYQGRSRLP